MLGLDNSEEAWCELPLGGRARAHAHAPARPAQGGRHKCKGGGAQAAPAPPGAQIRAPECARQADPLPSHSPPPAPPRRRCIDRRVNTYPSLRSFTAIGSGGSSFRLSMVSAVQAVVGRVELVSQRASSGGRYVSVTVGPVLVTSPDDVAEIYSRMRGDGRLRYFL